MIWLFFEFNWFFDISGASTSTTQALALDWITYIHTRVGAGTSRRMKPFCCTLRCLLEYMQSILKTTHSTFYCLGISVGLWCRFSLLFTSLLFKRTSKKKSGWMKHTKEKELA